VTKNVEWSLRAKASLDHYCSIIAEDSPISAMKVRREIVLSSKELSTNPYLYQVDEYYKDNPGNIRRYFRWSYRVVYQVLEDKIVVLEIYHTSSTPET